MPEKREFIPTKDCLSAKEIVKLCNNLVELGVDEIRLTGGEPLLRSDVREIVEGLSSLNISKLGLTTNAIKLKKNLHWLKNTNCKYINISLDSLDENKFFQITKTDLLKEVLEAILLAKEMGFVVKINTVLMKGVNDNEILDFLKFSSQNDIEVRFLELMKIGTVLPVFDKLFISADEAIKIIEQKWQLESQNVPADSTSFRYIAKFNKSENMDVVSNAKVGFIASESKPFCTGCSRLRLGPKGDLRPCLMVDHGVSLKGLNINELEDTLWRVISLKPQNRIQEVAQPMYQIGG
jgi:cyclic pyranopterin phosphate synthase